MSAELQDLPIGRHRDGHAGPDVSLRLQMRVNKEIRYDVLHTTRPVFDLEDRTLVQIVGSRPLLIVFDRTVEMLYRDQWLAYARQHLHVIDTVIIDGDESNKTWRQTEIICDAAMRCGLGRDGVIVGIGGGVTLDVSGFAASIFRRGVAFLRIPTTLIGQVDVSVGIKQGVNAGRFKNILGSFYPPLASINDVSFLRSLPRAQIAAGLAEVLKMGVIADPVLFELVELHGAALWSSRFQLPRQGARIIMERAEGAMLRELQSNLFEEDLERLVDFGHTFSPAIESASNYSLTHGHAVGLDMLLSTYIAVEREICPRHVLERLLRIYARIDLPITQNFCSPAQLHESLEMIRAHRGGALNLVVPLDIGTGAFLQDVHPAELLRAAGYFAAVRGTDAADRI